MASRAAAMASFSAAVNATPGACSPSRRVVSQNLTGAAGSTVGADELGKRGPGTVITSRRSRTEGHGIAPEQWFFVCPVATRRTLGAVYFSPASPGNFGVNRYSVGMTGSFSRKIPRRIFSRKNL
jgi:hypothetical protein